MNKEELAQIIRDLIKVYDLDLDRLSDAFRKQVTRAIDIYPMEFGDVTCDKGHEFKVCASVRKPEEERLSFCPTCFSCVTAPMVKDKSRWVDW